VDEQQHVRQLVRRYGTVIFNSTTSQTMAFAALAGDEFYAVTFRSTAASGAVIFSMATNGLRGTISSRFKTRAGSTTTLATDEPFPVGRLNRPR